MRIRRCARKQTGSRFTKFCQNMSEHSALWFGRSDCNSNHASTGCQGRLSQSLSEPLPCNDVTCDPVPRCISRRSEQNQFCSHVRLRLIFRRDVFSELCPKRGPCGIFGTSWFISSALHIPFASADRSGGEPDCFLYQCLKLGKCTRINIGNRRRSMFFIH